MAEVGKEVSSTNKSIIHAVVAGISIQLVVGIFLHYKSSVIVEQRQKSYEEKAELRFSYLEKTVDLTASRVNEMEKLVPAINQNVRQIDKKVDSIVSRLDQFTPIVNRTDRHFDKIND